MDYMSFVWLGIAVAALLVEAGTAALVSLWFVPAALVSMVMAYFEVPLGVQIADFVVISAVLILFMKKIFRRTLGIKPVATNADAVIGEQAVVTEAINNLEAHGQVKVKGQIWTARAFDQSTTYEVGEVLSVIAIEGVKLICKK